MVTGSRNMIRFLGAPGNDIPKALFSSVKCSKKSRRFQKRLDSCDASKRLEPAIKTGTLPSHCIPTEDECLSIRTIGSTVLPSPLSSLFVNESGQKFIPNFLREKIHYLLSQEKVMYVDNKHLLSVNSELDDKMDSTLRTDTLAMLWSLHSAYFTLSSIIFCKAVCLMDSFLAKVKVKPKYALCVASACYYIASKFERVQDNVVLTPENLVGLSRCGGTAADLTRMVDIILTKLGTSFVTVVGACSASVLDFLVLFSAFGFSNSSSASRFNECSKNYACVGSFVTPLPTFLCRQVELALISTDAACFRPSCLALALLSQYSYTPRTYPNRSRDEDWLCFHFADLFTLAQLCNVPWSDVDSCALAIKSASHPTSKPDIFQDYSPSTFLSSSPPLVWTLSRRTQRSISTSSPPTLATIHELDNELQEIEHDTSRLDLNVKTLETRTLDYSRNYC